MQIIGIVIAIAAIATAVYFYLRFTRKKSPHSNAQMLRFANNSASDVLASNWNHDEYYSRMYKYASPELASNMYKNKSLLNKVLDERAELFGDFVELKEADLGRQPFSFVPSSIYEVTATLHCAKGRVPIVILVNADKEELSLDGIRVLKKELTVK